MEDSTDFISKIPSLNETDFLSNTINDLNELKANSEDQMKCTMELFVTHLQAKIVRRLQKFESQKEFFVDRWLRNEGGGGITCVLQDGDVFEKAGVNISVVWGVMHPDQVKSMKSRGKDLITDGENKFFATGISSVIHPVNPFVPTMHFNYRYFEVSNESGKRVWWFGGGTDLTPSYINEKDFIHFHSCQKNACDKHGENYYPRFKKWADDYFYNPSRGEHRGVGGIFFDDFDEKPIKECFKFVESCGNAVLPSYIPMITDHKDDSYTPQQREWQLVRRGRYVEFNLVYDRGTKFGLATPGARIESVLISLPLTAKWLYMHQVEADGPEDKMLEILKNARDWIL